MPWREGGLLETDIVIEICEYCGGEGQLYTSRYGGNDPDVWPIGPCPACEGHCSAIIPAEPIEIEDLAVIAGDA
jgi:hypothetical protein